MRPMPVSRPAPCFAGLFPSLAPRRAASDAPHLSFRHRAPTTCPSPGDAIRPVLFSPPKPAHNEPSYSKYAPVSALHALDAGGAPRGPARESSAENVLPTPESQTRLWFGKVVLGLNLCPFAHQPAAANTVRFAVCDHADEQQLLDCVMDEVRLLEETDASVCETSLLIIPHLLDDFYDYHFFLQEANRLLKREQWEGVFQVAGFHPRYCFAGSEMDDPSNLTNRSPLPLVHILREDSLTAAVESFPDTETIHETNIETVQSLSPVEKELLFPHLNEN